MKENRQPAICAAWRPKTESQRRNRIRVFSNRNLRFLLRRRKGRGMEVSVKSEISHILIYVPAGAGRWELE